MGNLFRASPVHNQIWLINECLWCLFFSPRWCINIANFSLDAEKLFFVVQASTENRKCLEDNDQGKMSRMGWKTKKLETNKKKIHSTLIKTHHRMQSDENKLTWPARLCSRNEKLRPHYTSAAKSNSFLASYLKCHTRKRSIIKCEMFHSKCEKWKMKTSPHSAAAEKKNSPWRVWEISLHFSPLTFARCEMKVHKCASIFNYPSKPRRTFLDELISNCLSSNSLGRTSGIFRLQKCRTSFTVDEQQRQMFLKEIMFVIFISTEKAVKTIQDHRKTGRRAPEGHHPFVFACPSALESTKKGFCNFPISGVFSFAVW